MKIKSQTAPAYSLLLFFILKGDFNMKKLLVAYAVGAVVGIGVAAILVSKKVGAR